MSDEALLKRIEAGRKAVLAQTDLMHREFGKVRSDWKSDGTRVTPVDIAISKAIQASLHEACPEDQFFSEELSEQAGPIPVTSHYCWMLDPIDGTNNYALGLPQCAICLALFESGLPVYGFVYDLARRKLIEGGPGFGVTDGGVKVPPRNEMPNPQSLIGFHSPFDPAYAAQAVRLLQESKIRGLGSSTLHLAYVAIGLLDGVVDHNVRLWDIAGAIPLLWANRYETRFLNGLQFPFASFNLNMPRIFYVAGTPRMCDHLCELLDVSRKPRIHGV